MGPGLVATATLALGLRAFSFDLALPTEPASPPAPTFRLLGDDTSLLKPSTLPETAGEPTGGNPYIIAGSTAVVVAAIAAWGWSAWWSDGFSEFHLLDTGFFGQDTYAGGADKLGHMYGAYLATLAVTRMYEALGMTHEGATLLSGIMITLGASGIEIADGFTEFGFEYSDAIFNTLGTALAFAAEMWPEFHAIIGLRLAYVPSRDFLAHDKTLVKWINDYTGMLFYLDVKGKGVMEALDREPGWLRYVMTGPVYGTERYSPRRVHNERRRSLGWYVGLSLPEIMRSYFDDDKGVEAFAKFFDYYAMPFLSVSAMSDLNTGDWYINFGVANRGEIGL